MAVFLELLSTIVILVTKPFSLVKLSCLFCVRSLCIVLQTWAELLKDALCFHVNIFWRLLVWVIAILSLPVRVLTALQRNRLLEIQLHQMQRALENLVWERNELDDQLKEATRERKIVEVIFAELEDEHEEAINKIEQLENELHNLKSENKRFREDQGKALWDHRGKGDADGKQNVSGYGISWNPSGIESPVAGQEQVHTDAWRDEDKSKNGSKYFRNLGSAAYEPNYALNPEITSRDLQIGDVLEQRREIALSRSRFSAILSLLVGIIIWQSADPCMPLVVALFTVVCLSLKSVIQFFSTIQNKPASDAVTLLSFNWFILGTLTYPTLPRVARMLAPLACSSVKQTIMWFGFSL